MTYSVVFAICSKRIALISGLTNLIQMPASSVNTPMMLESQWVVFENRQNQAVILLTRFNKIAIQGKGPDSKWTRKPLTYR